MSELTSHDISRLVEHLDRLVEFSHEANIGKRLVDLFDNVSTLIIHRDSDCETSEPDGFTVTVVASGSQMMTCSREELLDALRATFSGDKGKRCRVCGRVKALSAFSRLAESRDRKNRRCKVCEQTRVKRYEQQKKQVLPAADLDVCGAPAAPVRPALRRV